MRPSFPAPQNARTCGSNSFPPATEPPPDESQHLASATLGKPGRPDGSTVPTGSSKNEDFISDTPFSTDAFGDDPISVDEYGFFDFSNDLAMNWLFSNGPSDDLFGALPGVSTDLQDLPDDRFNSSVGKLPQQPSSSDTKDTMGPHYENCENAPGASSAAPASEDPWPMAWNAAPLKEKPLPPLGRDDGVVPRVTGVCQKWPIKNTLRDDIQKMLGSCLERSLWNNVSLANFPSTKKLNYCVDLFFARFNVGTCFVHRPTFDASSQQCVPLVLAMATIGACFTELEGAKPFAHCLSELNRRLLMCMSERETLYLRAPEYVAAHILQGTYGFCCGSKRLFDMSERLRPTIVHHARGMGLFQEPTQTNSSPSTSDDCRWKAWIAKERHRRLGWAVYGYDGAVSYLHNRRPSASVEEMTLGLPCDLALWEVKSAQAWTALYAHSDTEPQNIPFRTAMRSMYGVDPDASVRLSDQHKRLLAGTLARFLWTLKEIESSPIIDVVPNKWPVSEGKQDMLDKLDRFISSPNPRAETKTAVAVRTGVQLNQIVHMAHLTAGGDLLDWLHSLACSSGKHPGARARMAQWASENAQRVRDVTLHSAQMLACVREYSCNHPTESSNAFWAGISLWSMAQLLPTMSSAPEPRSSSMQLDYLGEPGDPNYDALVAWVKQGATQALSLHDIPDLVTPEGRLAVLKQTAGILERMSVWGISNNFFMVIMQLVREEQRLDKCE